MQHEREGYAHIILAAFNAGLPALVVPPLILAVWMERRLIEWFRIPDYTYIAELERELGIGDATEKEG